MLNTLAIDKKYLLNKIETLNKINVDSIVAEDLNAVIDEFSKKTIMKVENGTAYIEIYGELVNKTSWIAELFGFKQTLYSDILKSLNLVKQDDSIEKVQLAISSPGGHVSGLMTVMNAIAAFDKPIESVVDMCCSAAYFIASQTNKITAVNKLSMIGSVGVLASFVDDSEYMNKLGIKDIVITSTDAPNKYADPATKKGYGIIQAEQQKYMDEHLSEYLKYGHEQVNALRAKWNEKSFNFRGIRGFESPEKYGKRREETFLKYLKKEGKALSPVELARMSTYGGTTEETRKSTSIPKTEFLRREAEVGIAGGKMIAEKLGKKLKEGAKETGAIVSRVVASTITNLNIANSSNSNVSIPQAGGGSGQSFGTGDEFALSVLRCEIQ